MIPFTSLHSGSWQTTEVLAHEVVLLTRRKSSVPVRGSGAVINTASVAAIAPEFLNGVYDGTKAFLFALSPSLCRELADRGVRVQMVLPGSTATDFWEIAGKPVHQLPQEIVMPVDVTVDAALAGLDQGEFATIPSLPDASDCQAYDGVCQALFPNLSRAAPAERCLVSSRTPANCRTPANFGSGSE